MLIFFYLFSLFSGKIVKMRFINVWLDNLQCFETPKSICPSPDAQKQMHLFHYEICLFNKNIQCSQRLDEDDIYLFLTPIRRPWPPIMTNWTWVLGKNFNADHVAPMCLPGNRAGFSVGFLPWLTKERRPLFLNLLRPKCSGTYRDFNANL